MAAAPPLSREQARRVLLLAVAGYVAVLLGALATAATGSLLPALVGLAVMTLGVDRAVRQVVGATWRHVFTRTGTDEAAAAAGWDVPLVVLGLRMLPGVAVGVGLAVLLRHALVAVGVL